MLVFGNQSLQVDNDTNSEALYKAKAILERARASSTVDFLSINSLPSVTSSIYSLKLDVLDLTPCRKEAISTITWSVSPIRPQKIELISDFTDIAGAFAMGGDCDSTSPGDWDYPDTYGDIDLIPSGNKGTGLDVIVRNGVDYVFLTSNTGAVPKPDFWIVDVSNPQVPTVIN